MKPIVYPDSDFLLIYILCFAAGESLFALVLACQPLSSSRRMAIFVITFAFFLSFQVTQSMIQYVPTITKEAKLQACWSPLAAIKHTIDTYGQFFLLDWPMTFDNYHEEKNNWSLKLGLEQFIKNTIVYILIGVGLDLLMNLYNIIEYLFLMRKVVFDNCNMGIIEIKDLQERNIWKKEQTSIQFHS